MVVRFFPECGSSRGFSNVAVWIEERFFFVPVLQSAANRPAHASDPSGTGRVSGAAPRVSAGACRVHPAAHGCLR